MLCLQFSIEFTNAQNQYCTEFIVPIERFMTFILLTMSFFLYKTGNWKTSNDLDAFDTSKSPPTSMNELVHDANDMPDIIRSFPVTSL